MTDVTVTWEVFTRLADRYASYGLDVPLHRIVSEASVGKAHLSKMRIMPWRLTQDDVPDWLIAMVMETYYGGRTETRVRKLAVPGVYVDFLSEYPSVYVLQELWRFQVAQRIDWTEEDVDRLTAWIDGVIVDDVLDPELWLHLACIVQVAPDGDLLPTRARYNPNSPIFNVAIAHRYGSEGWWTLADVIASKIATGKIPSIVRAIRFTPGAPKGGMKDITVAGNPDFTVNPYEDDFIARLIELRSVAKTNKKHAAANHDTADAEYWDAVQHGLKITANSVSYGIGIELNTTTHRKPMPVTVHNTDGTTIQTRTRKQETEGSWFNPIIGTFTAAGGRLLLASLIAQVRDAGGTYVFCDTDSLFPAATRDGGPITIIDRNGTTHVISTLSWQQIDDIVDRYTALNPYDPCVVPGSILKIEDINFHPDTGEQRQIEAYSIASKRYAIVTRQPDDTYRLAVEANGATKRSEHGLGHLVPPAAGWEGELWEWIINTDAGHEWPEPEWFDQPALGRITINTPHELQLLRHINEGKPYRDQIRPGGFLTSAHAHPIAESGLLVAPFVSSPDKALASQAWIDRSSGVGRLQIRNAGTEYSVSGCVVVLDYRHYALQYQHHDEWKAQRKRPPVGPLGVRGVYCHGTSSVGKEAPGLGSNGLQDDQRPGGTLHLCRYCGCPLRSRQMKWCSDRCRRRWARYCAA